MKPKLITEIRLFKIRKKEFCHTIYSFSKYHLSVRYFIHEEVEKQKECLKRYQHGVIIILKMGKNAFRVVGKVRCTKW